MGQLQEVQYSYCRGAREEKEQDAGNLFEKIMKENFPNLVKEIDMQVQEASPASPFGTESQTRWMQRGPL